MSTFNMFLTPTNSSHVKAQSYDPATKALTVQFHNGRTYRHQNVPANVAAGFQKAASASMFYIQNLRKRYNPTEIRA